MPIAKEPIVFRKATSCIHCPNDPVMLPPPRAKFHEQGDCRTWPGLHHRQRRERARVPRTRYAVGEGQGCDTFDPIGPWLVTTDKIDNVQRLAMWLDVNGRRIQTGNTKTMMFNFAKLVSYCSHFMTLESGDVITTGTPPSVAWA